MDLRYTHYLQAEELTAQAAEIRAKGAITIDGWRQISALLGEAKIHAQLATAEKLVEMQAEMQMHRDIAEAEATPVGADGLYEFSTHDDQGNQLTPAEES